MSRFGNTGLAGSSAALCRFVFEKIFQRPAATGFRLGAVTPLSLAMPLPHAPAHKPRELDWWNFRVGRGEGKPREAIHTAIRQMTERATANGATQYGETTSKRSRRAS